MKWQQQTGSVALFRVGPADARRVVLTEAAIDALSKAQLEKFRPDTLYVSTGGAFGPGRRTAREIVHFAREGRQLVAAFDRDDQGERYAQTVRELVASIPDAQVTRQMSTRGKDWNDQLRDSDDSLTNKPRPPTEPPSRRKTRDEGMER